MTIALNPNARQNLAEASATPLADINPAEIDRFAADTIWPVFDRLRREDPVHFTPESEFGPYWSITRWEDIMAVDTDHEAFSSVGGIALIPSKDQAEQEKILAQMGSEPRRGSGFIAMDEPEHSVHRKAVSPTVAPANIAKMAPIVREGAGRFSTRCRSASRSTGSTRCRRS